MKVKEKNRKRKPGRHRKKSLFTAGVLTVLLLTGCSGSEEKTKAAMEAVQKLDYEGALALFEQAREAGEDSRLICRGRGIAYMGLTEYESAIDCFRTALSDSDGIPQDVDYDMNYYLAAAYMKNGQYSEAKAAYDAILSLRPEEEDAYFLRGNALLHLSDMEGAKADFDKVVSMDAQNYDRLIAIYETLDLFGYGQQGQAYLQNALTAAQKDMEQYDIGRIYYYLGDYQKAAIALEEAREKGGAESSLYLGKAYEAMGDYNYASSVYNSFISRGTENSAEIYNQLGLCEMAKKEYQKALEAFEAGLKLEDNPIRQTMLFNEIVAYENLGDFQKAAVLLENYLSLYPDDEAAKREQQFLSTR